MPSSLGFARMAGSHTAQPLPVGHPHHLSHTYSHDKHTEKALFVQLDAGALGTVRRSRCHTFTHHTPAGEPTTPLQGSPVASCGHACKGQRYSWSSRGVAVLQHTLSGGQQCCTVTSGASLEVSQGGVSAFTLQPCIPVQFPASVYTGGQLMAQVCWRPS